jgi:hypothetical protein
VLSLIVVLWTMLDLVTPPPDVVADMALADSIVNVGCISNRTPNRAMVLSLLSIERAAGIPELARGLTVAAACRESGMKPTRRGDWRLKSDRRVHCKEGETGCKARALGLFQHWRWARKGIKRVCGWTWSADIRTEWKCAARFWARHVVAQVPSVRKHCRYKDELAVWKAAHRTAVTMPKCVSRTPGGRCRKWRPRCPVMRAHRSSHWKTRLTFQNPAPPVLVLGD